MTRTYNEKLACDKCGTRICCPNCKVTLTTETPFESWMRGNHLLDSQSGVVRFDLDVLIHRYKDLTDVRGDRTIQVMMFVEVKTFNATCSQAQKDTLHLLNQVLSNHRSNNKGRRKGWHATEHNPPVKAKSLIAGRDISLFLRGGHCLILSGDSPSRSSQMLWDNKPITEAELIGLLRCEIDPDTLQPWDIRRRQISAKLLSAKLFD